jgi:hypothetical protein
LRSAFAQRLCAETLRNPQRSARDKAGAAMGLADWVMEEVLIHTTTNGVDEICTTRHDSQK